MTEATDALQQMAREVAAQLVAEAMRSMVANVRAMVTVTVHPQPAQPPRQLPPAPVEKRRGRKLARKPGRKSKKWTAEQRANFAATMAARRQPKPAASAPAKRGRPRKVVDEARCTRCDHTRDEHDGDTGKCLSFRCTCAGFYQ